MISNEPAPHPRRANSMPLEILHSALVLLGGGTRGEGAEIAPPAGLRILLARVQPVSSGRELADNGSINDQVEQWFRLATFRPINRPRL